MVYLIITVCQCLALIADIGAFVPSFNYNSNTLPFIHVGTQPHMQPSVHTQDTLTHTYVDKQFEQTRQQRRQCLELTQMRVHVRVRVGLWGERWGNWYMCARVYACVCVRLRICACEYVCVQFMLPGRAWWDWMCQILNAQTFRSLSVVSDSGKHSISIFCMHQRNRVHGIHFIPGFIHD